MQLSLLQRVTQLWDPLHLRLWSEKYRQRQGVQAFAVRQVEIFFFTARSIRGGEIARRAAALTYHTLLAIVPMLAVGFALFKAFGGLHALEAPLRELIVEYLAVGRADEVGRWLDQFIDNISAGAIAGVGVLLLFYSAVGLLTNTEKAFNRIWGVEQGRAVHLRFAVYWCMLTLGPALLGLSISVSAQLQRSAVATSVVAWLPFGLGKLLLSLGSALAVCVAFVLAYLIVPNTKVQFRPALLGGIVAGILWSITKSAFVWVTAGSVKYSAVYGALGALPLLMIWFYISWIIVLFGVSYTYANQAAASGKLQESMTTTSHAFREYLAVRLMTRVANAHRLGVQPPTAQDLSERTAASIGLVRHVMNVLRRHGVVIQTGSTADGGYLPARDLACLSVQDVVDALRHKDGAVPALNDDDVDQRVREVLASAEQASHDILSRVDLRSFAPDGAATPTPAKDTDSQS